MWVIFVYIFYTQIPRITSGVAIISQCPLGPPWFWPNSAAPAIWSSVAAACCQIALCWDAPPRRPWTPPAACRLCPIECRTQLMCWLVAEVCRVVAADAKRTPRCKAAFGRASVRPERLRRSVDFASSPAPSCWETDCPRDWVTSVGIIKCTLIRIFLNSGCYIYLAFNRSSVIILVYVTLACIGSRRWSAT